MERKEAGLEELLEIVRRYEDRSIELFRNAREFIDKRELEKAGEFLWGSVTSLINALTVLETGKTTRSHDELVRRGVEIAEALRDVHLREVVRRVGQRLHANYYHGFLSLDEFGELYQEILYAIEQFKLVLQSELSRLLG